MVLVVLHGKVRAMNAVTFHGFKHRMVLMELMNGRDDRKSDALSPNWKNHYPPISGRLYESGH